MKARTPKEWNDLSPRSQKIVSDYCVKLLNEQEEKDMRIVVERLVKMFCCLLHDTQGYGEKRLTMLVGNLQMVFKEQSSLVNQGKQVKFLDERMEKIFRKNGFPQSFIDNLLGPKDEDSLGVICMEEVLGCRKQ